MLFDLCTHVGFKPLHGRLINDQRIFVFQSTKRNPLEQAFRNVLRLIRLVRKAIPGHLDCRMAQSSMHWRFTRPIPQARES